MPNNSPDCGGSPPVTPAIRAGQAFKERIENDPEARAAWDRTRERMQSIVKAMQDVVNSPEYQKAKAAQRRAIQELVDTIRVELDNARDTLYALAWADRQVAEAKLAAEAVRPNTAIPSTSATEGEKPDAQSAKQLLHGWRAIDDALKLSESYPNMNYDERRRKLAYLNDYYGGPIKTGRKGSQPIVNRSELIAWWNSLEKLVEKQAKDQKARILSEETTLRNLRPYGRTALVAPDLGGSVKRRRKSSSRKPDKT